MAEYIESNPLLETEEFSENNNDDSQDSNDFEETLQENYCDAFSDTFSDTSTFDTQSYENVWQDDYQLTTTTSDNAYSPILHLTEDIPFKSFIRHQIDLRIHKKDREMAYALCDLLTDEGYLPPSFEEDMILLGHENFNKIENILECLQTLEPTGVFARSLEECLILQLKYRGLYSPEIERFLLALKSHAGSPNDLARKLHIPLETCTDYLNTLKTLHPKPGLSMGKSTLHQVIPDILMAWRNPHEWSLELNPINLPKVYLNSSYYIELRSMMKSTNDKIFLQEKFTEAKWLLKSLHQRAMNIMKVTHAIIRKQAAFFRSPMGSIKPLTLKEIALETDLSESTVSRVTTDKYIETPRGLFELKYFFSMNVNAREHDNLHSAKSIQSLIRKIISEENQAMPLSDSDIVERLKLMGISVARRTVAKYRDVLRIENASERLKYYKWGQKNAKILAIES